MNENFGHFQFADPAVAAAFNQLAGIIESQQRQIQGLQERVAELSVLADPLASTEEKTAVAQKLAAESEEKRRLQQLREDNLSQLSQYRSK